MKIAKRAAPRISRRFFRLTFGLLCTAALLAISAAACASASARQPTAGSEPAASSTPTALVATTSAPQSSPTARPSSTTPPGPTSTAIPSLTPLPVIEPCQQDLCSYAGPLFLRRPIDPPGNDSVDVTYRFGSTQSGLREPHHGVEFLNGYGTPVLAAGDGKVVVAGTDYDPTSPQGAWPITFYGPYSNFYGNLVVIEHSLPPAVQAAFPGLAGPIYSLYGHLSAISVQVDQQVQVGQEIGKVGMAGIATGSHLHFEVRLGENSYTASHNPELWLAPHTGESGQLNGAIAGRFLDSYDQSLEMPSIVLQHLPDGPDGPSDFQVTVITYEEKGLIGQPPFQESFGLGDLAPGLYRISFPMGGLRRELVTIYPGQLTVVTFRSQ